MIFCARLKVTWELSSAFPCLWCYIPLRALSPSGETHSPKVTEDAGESWVDNPSWNFHHRNPYEIVQDLADNLADPRKGGNTKANGPSHTSISNQSILPIIHDIKHIVPPILHIMLGLVVRFYRNVENLCRRRDQGNLGERDEELNDNWQGLSIEVEEREREYKQSNMTFHIFKLNI